MSFEIQEESIEDGQPIDLFEFYAGGEYFRFTNGETSQFRSGSTFYPGVISRDDIKRSGSKFESEVELQLSISDNSVSDFSTQWARFAPDGSTTIAIYEKHITDGAAEFRTSFLGEVQSIRYDHQYAYMLCKSMGDFLTREGPKDTWSASCENQFGDDYCNVVLPTYTKTLGLSSISTSGITLTINTLGDGQVDGDYRGGYVKITDRIFDFRYIVDHTGDQLTIQQPFGSLVAGQTLSIVQGCHKTIRDCIDRFANIEHYGGTPYTPRQNPFSSSLDNL